MRCIAHLYIPLDSKTKEPISIQRLHKGITKWLANEPEIGCGNNKSLGEVLCPSNQTSCRVCAISKENRIVTLKLIKQRSIAEVKASIIIEHYKGLNHG